MNFLAFSGGKDSTACAYRLAELGEPFVMLFTPTGNELPELYEHIKRVRLATGAPLVTPPNRTLAEWIATWTALPNQRQRWCTRVIKIEPCIAYLQRHPGSTLLVGLRADEDDREGGLYGEHVTYRRPLREWGWGLADVQGYLRRLGVVVPVRTDCAVCPYQRLGEWWALWKDHPEMFAQGEAWERDISVARGYQITFRSKSRDTWPAGLAGLRAEFERGREPRSVVAARQRCLDAGDEDEGAPEKCRVCSK